MNRINLQPGRGWLSAALVLVFMVAASGVLRAQATCDPRAYGARGDGTTKDTAAIQEAIDACAGKGGGTVELSAGTYCLLILFPMTPSEARWNATSIWYGTLPRD